MEAAVNRAARRAERAFEAEADEAHERLVAVALERAVPKLARRLLEARRRLQERPA